MIIMKKILVLFITFFILAPTSFAYSEAYVVMDADSGRVLGSKNMNEKNLIASTTKIMTALVAIENGNLDSIITAGDEILSVYGSMIYLDIGEEMTLEDLIYGLMYQSGNDAAMTIASNIMDYDKFIETMNKKAIEIGMLNTNFENPHGLDDETKNYSTAYDLALLMRYATKNKTFMNITGSKKYIVDSNVERHIWYNKNKLLSTYKYATSGKIGYTTKSKHVFVSSATKGSENLVIATIKDSDRFNTHKNLYEKYFEDYDSYTILDKMTFNIKEDYYKDYHLYIKNNLQLLLNDEEKEKIKLNIELVKLKKVEDGSNVGSVNILINDNVIHSEKIYVSKIENKIQKIKNWLFFWKN